MTIDQAAPTEATLYFALTVNPTGRYQRIGSTGITERMGAAPDTWARTSQDARRRCEGQGIPFSAFVAVKWDLSDPREAAGYAATLDNVEAWERTAPTPPAAPRRCTKAGVYEATARYLLKETPERLRELLSLVNPKARIGLERAMKKAKGRP